MPETKQLPLEIIGLSGDDDEGQKDAAIPKPGKDPRSVAVSQPTTRPGRLNDDSVVQAISPRGAAVGRSRR